MTGIAGIVLIGGAIYIAFDGKWRMAVRPNFSPSGGTYALASFAPGQISAGRKGDRISTPAIGEAVKQVMQESTVTRVGSKEFIQVKPHIRMVVGLPMTASELTDNLPPFDPLKLFAEAADEGASEPAPAPAVSNGDIVVALADLPLDGSTFEDSYNIDRQEAEDLMREALNLAPSGAGFSVAGSSAHDGGGDSLLVEGGESLSLPELGGIAGTPSNVTELNKTLAIESESPDIAHKQIEIGRGDTLMSVLIANDATTQDAKAIADAMSEQFSVKKIKDGFSLRLTFVTTDDSEQPRIARVSLFDDDKHLATVGLAEPNPEGKLYVALDESDALGEDDETLQIAAKGQARATLYRSLYEAGRRNGLPEQVIDQIMRIQSYDVDFNRRVQSGDSMEVFYVADDPEGQITGEPQILYTSLNIRGEQKRFYRFRAPDDGSVDFYDEDGNSAKKFLIRKPLNGGVLRSTFGMRRHPILGYMKMHTGVDWAARSGTPIVAAGNGVVEKAEWSSGYGRYTVIRHANGYKSAYAHQSAFADGLHKGMRVKQGQVIGYVGTTGLSTGPHLHFEVVVNGRYVDPMRIRVPRGRTLQGHILANFEKEKQRIDTLIRQGGGDTRLADAASLRQ